MPSAKVLEAKKAQVAEVIETLKEAQTGVIVDYRGLTVEEDTDLRTKLRNANVKYFVIKNTLLLRAAKEVGLEALEEALHGPTAIAVSSEDAVAPAKVLADYAKENEKLEIKSGFMDGAVMTLDEIKKLAATPNFETLIAKMMGSLNSPISALARTLQAIADGGVEIPDLIAKQAGEAKEEAPAAEEAPAEEKAEEAPAAEEAAPAAEEAPAEEPKAAEEAPAETADAE
ncbi:MAG: 50S ribosomal protein L10 [Clostridia bacterium]|nr:50S ribosomal protein L10 [Clostridia bacterium]MBQ9598741.1 50S ribosomal protein L10 [Clostridia bacterium]